MWVIAKKRKLKPWPDIVAAQNTDLLLRFHIWSSCGLNPFTALAGGRRVDGAVSKRTQAKCLSIPFQIGSGLKAPPAFAEDIDFPAS